MFVRVAILCLALSRAIAVDQLAENLRLPEEIRPIHYEIYLDVSQTLPKPGQNPARPLKFHGNVSIDATALKDLQQITLHAANITVKSAQVNNINADHQMPNAPANSDFLKLKANVKANAQIKIFIDFEALLHEDMYGFYLSTYDDNNVRQQGTTGNIDKFEKTPPMSTYLVAFVVSELSNTEGVNNSKINVWARPNAKLQTHYTANIAGKVVDALDNFTGIPFFTNMINKLDMMALPDFAAGAMENWGILTYRETALLYDEVESSERDKQRVVTVVAHEMAHQWFGDYVTTKWWDSTWLNEGFATYFEYHITDIVKPDWEMKGQFLVEQQHEVFGSDALENTKCLTTPVNTPTEIQAHFDSISYNKGGCIIRMMEHILGHNVFQKGLQRYLNKNKFGSVVPQDLFNALEEQAQMDKVSLDSGVAHIMSSWTDQPGYPVVNVEAKDDFVTFSQERFFSTKNLTEEDKRFWHVPISYTVSTEYNFSNTKPRFWLTPQEPNKYKLIKDLDWIIVNIQETGYYRVNYDTKLWEKIADVLKSKNSTKIHKLNRAQIIDDAMNLARAGQLNYEVAFDVIGFLSEEVDYFPWYTAFNAFRYLLQRYPEDKETGALLRDYLVKLMKTLLESKSLKDSDNTTHIDVFNRAQALNWACNLGKDTCIKDAKNLFERIDTEKVPKNVRETVYCVGIREGNQTTWQKLWDKYKQANVAAEKVRILNALGCSNDATQLKKYLDLSISNEIRQQDAAYAFSAVYTGSQKGVGVALDFLKDNYAQIRDRYGGMNALGKAISGLAARLTDEKQITELSDFLKKNSDNLKDIQIISDAAIESARANIAWSDKYDETIKEFLKKQRNGSTVHVFQPLLLILSLLIAYLNFNGE